MGACLAAVISSTVEKRGRKDQGVTQGGSIVRYIGQRVLLYVPMLLLLTLVVFLLMRVIPGDPALLILAGTPGDGSFTKADLANLRRELGTDRPVFVRAAVSRHPEHRGHQ